VADGLLAGLAAYLGARTQSVRIGLEGSTPGADPQARPGDGPMFWATELPEGPLRLRVTNTGTEPLAAGARLVAGWEPSDEPYLRVAPAAMDVVGEPLPALAPGESVTVELVLPESPSESRALAWISLSVGATTLAEAGAPALQLATGTP
jgi:hypothetical protein